jgi:hypothetical protein
LARTFTLVNQILWRIIYLNLGPSMIVF